MPPSHFLFTSPWADRSLEQLAPQVREWGYQGLELCCWGQHLDVRRAQTDSAYLENIRDLCARHDLTIPVLSNHRVGQAVCDRVEEWYQPYLPDAVWGNGKLSEISGRAAEEMVNTFRVAEQLGAQLVSGFTGSPIWGAVSGYPSLPVQRIRDAFAQFADRWNPILDVAGDLGVRFACEIHPGQLAFDLYSAELILEAVDHRPEFGFTFDPSHLHWLGVDPVEFLRKFPDRIFHVHIKDATLSLDGRSSVLTGYWPSGDPRRGWQFRSPGRGGIDWDAILRTLYQIGYSGIFSVDWHDPDLDRDFGAQDAAEFLQRLVFEPRRPLPR